MVGKVLNYDKETKSGIILNDNDIRYDFKLEILKILKLYSTIKLLILFQMKTILLLIYILINKLIKIIYIQL